MGHHAGSMKLPFISGSVLPFLAVAATACGQDQTLASGPTRIVAVHGRSPASASKSQASGSQSPGLLTATPFPRPPLSGFTPYIAITTSNSHSTEAGDWEHVKRLTYAGNALNPPASQNYVIGILDAGSNVDVVGYCSSARLGLTASWLTGNTVELSGAGGVPFDADVSKALGLFAHSLAGIDATGALNTSTIKGHTNVSTIVLPAETCGDGPELPAFMGTPFLAFFNSVILNDQPKKVTVQEVDDANPPTYTRTVTYKGPDVQIKQQSDTLPTYPIKISMNFSPILPGFPITAAFYTTDQDFLTPETPTQIADGFSYFPLGGAFFGSMGVLEGTPSPTNPLQTMRVVIDTGAQACIMTPGMAANLNMPAEPDFEVEILGVGGSTTAPGYYVDYVKINASGGPLEYSQVPFVVLEIPSPDGGQVDGIMGMSLFWNRNVIFQPCLTGSGCGFFHVSNVIPFAYGDFDHDFHVDQDDFAFFQTCTSGPGIPQTNPECTQVDHDMDGDVDHDDFGAFQRCYSGATTLANVNCQ